MSRAVFNPALTEYQAELELALDIFREKFSAASLIDEMRGAVLRGKLKESPEVLAQSTIREFHKQCRNVVKWTEESLEVASRQGMDSLVLDRIRVNLDFAKRREGFLWLEVLSFSDESSSVKTLDKQGELCLF